MDKDDFSLPDHFYSQVSEVLGPQFWQDIGELIPVTGPRIDVYFNDSSVYVLAELPELQNPSQISMRLDGNTLILEGEIPCPYPVTENRIVRKERFFGRFTRSLAMPRPVKAQGIKTRYRQGLLTVELPIRPTSEQDHIPVEF